MLTYEIQPARAQGNGFYTLVLHGLGDSMAGWKPAVPLFTLDQVGWAFANAPEAYGPYGGYSWFDMLPDMTPDIAGIVHSRHLLDELIGHLLVELKIPSEKLFLLGFSQGCLMVMDQALRGDRQFAGVVGISGWVNGLEEFPAEFGSAAKQQRILMTHGLHDDLLMVELIRDQANQLKELDIHLAWGEYDKAHSLDPDDEVADIRAFMQRCMTGETQASKQAH